MLPTPDNRPNARGSMTDSVMEHVRTSIVEGSMAPGEWYSVYRLADELEISRSPVRDALLRLEEIGVIRFAKNRGFQLVPTTPEDVAQIFSIRAALEIPAAGRAAQSKTDDQADRITELRQAMDTAAADSNEKDFFDRDQDLHAVILDAAGMDRAREMVNKLRVSTRMLGASTSQGLRTLEDISKEHEPIIVAVLGGDTKAARDAMDRHLAATGRLLVQQALSRSGDERDATTLWDQLTAGYFGETSSG
ncbi:GntR family transcriptional regulator [Brevibacterium zhoupengii]|uniref:GntR family transcriptional regulator n=1 Tax=Brevibacterium zhoupengii TaxID=2898795 RepID=UPI001E2CA4A0|nr:GntR family transcriptional regulator [Brevibacterium zhoupengii]